MATDNLDNEHLKAKPSCPNCGYCPACGRSYRTAPYYVPYPVLPTYPTYPQPIWYWSPATNPTVTCGTDLSKSNYTSNNFTLTC